MKLRVFVLFATLMLALSGCPADDSGGDSTDTSRVLEDAADTSYDDTADLSPNPNDDPVVDLQPDPVVDPQADSEDDPVVVPDADPPGCEFPSGPYAFTAVDDVVGPMQWTSAVIGEDETLAADLAAIRCDPDVHSIFIQIAAIGCTACPSRMREIGGLSGTWETHGAKWVFLVLDASSVSAANDYVENYGITFGWRSNDSDNSLGSNTIGDSPVFSAWPWTGVIRTSDMVLVYDEPDDAYLNLEAIAAELAGN